MKFMDPAQVDCSECRTRSEQSVDALLGLSAKCPQCGASFAAVGERMRRQVADVRRFGIALELLLEIEDNEGVRLPDWDADEVRSLDDLTRHIALHVGPGSAEESNGRAVAMVDAAVRSLYPDLPSPPRADDLDLCFTVPSKNMRAPASPMRA